jgi:hypothetical protein
MNIGFLVGAPHALWHEEYVELTGKPFSPPAAIPLYAGKPIKEAAPFYRYM